MEKRGYIHPDWTPDINEDNDNSEKNAGNGKPDTRAIISKLDADLTKSLLEQVAKQVKSK